ncbi:MAG: 7-carboxy-7-deazaguanine synthase QueE, partial [Armatimonadota bacterium]
MVSSHTNPEPLVDAHGHVYEVYSGIQGEGLLVGERQIFIRLAGCNLSCSYCDTPHARIASDRCRVEQTPGLRDFVAVSNPLAAEDVAAFVMRLNASRTLHHSVALTGGEPLVQAEFASLIARSLKRNGIRVFLETNGSLPDSLPKILPFLDYISMDIKLPSATGGPCLLDVHETFLRQAGNIETCVKMVVTRSSSDEEISE